MKKLRFLFSTNIEKYCLKTGFFVFLRMQHILGISRQQMRFSSLKEAISADNQVRFIDAFVTFLDLEKLGFAVTSIKSEGRLGYNIKVFLKIYLYGYLNGLRSSRKLEKECLRNIEMQWLLEDIRPNYIKILFKLILSL
ncbi:transposase [Flavobacterium sp. RS13.1]|uniref:transposase n=1 Tax=Flavobacterium sp. RS13.1 TaxID=3400345 RepID=UPI003AAA54BE